VVQALESGDVSKANALCETSNEPLAEVFERGLRVFRRRRQDHRGGHLAAAGHGVGSSATSGAGHGGSSAPFVGLFGTVVGILKAFQAISMAAAQAASRWCRRHRRGAGGHGGGLLVAIYAIIAYNYFVAKVNRSACSTRCSPRSFSSRSATWQGEATAEPPPPPHLPQVPEMGATVQLDDGSRPARRRAAGGGGRGDQHHPAHRRLPRLLIIFMVTSTAMVESEVATRTGVKVACRGPAAVR
jgi:hypothetical protein